VSLIAPKSTKSNNKVCNSCPFSDANANKNHHFFGLMSSFKELCFFLEILLMVQKSQRTTWDGAEAL